MTDMVLGFYCERLGGDWCVYLIHKKRPEWQKGKLNGIGGHVEPGESPYQAMRREFREEAGLDVNTWTHAVTLVSPTWRVHIFRVFSLDEQRTDHPTTQTEETVSWYRVGAMFPHTLVVPNLCWIVPLLFDMAVVGPVTVHVTDASLVANPV